VDGRAALLQADFRPTDPIHPPGVEANETPAETDAVPPGPPPRVARSGGQPTDVEIAALFDRCAVRSLRCSMASLFDRSAGASLAEDGGRKVEFTGGNRNPTPHPIP
jgi:hypothetical protein